MKKLLTLAAVAALGLTMLGGTSVSEAKNLEKEIVIGLDDNFAPMGFRNEKNEIVGFDIDLAKEAAKRLGMKVTFKPIDWDSKEAEIKSGRIDAIWNCFSVTEERKQTYGLSDAYINNAQWIVTLATSNINKVSDLAGKVVGVQNQATGDDILNSAPYAELRSKLKDLRKYPDFAAAYMDLQTGRVDALIADAVLAGYYNQKQPGVYRKADETVSDEVVAIGFRKEDTKLIAKINKVLKGMKKDGTCKAVSLKWFGSDITVY